MRPRVVDPLRQCICLLVQTYLLTGTKVQIQNTADYYMRPRVALRQCTHVNRGVIELYLLTGTKVQINTADFYMRASVVDPLPSIRQHTSAYVSRDSLPV
jgi:hypothetical protein